MYLTSQYLSALLPAANTPRYETRTPVDIRPRSQYLGDTIALLLWQTPSTQVVILTQRVFTHSSSQPLQFSQRIPKTIVPDTVSRAQSEVHGEDETTAHYLLYCTLNSIPRQLMFDVLIWFAPIATPRLLHGAETLDDRTNKAVFKEVQTFITLTNRLC